MKKLAILFALVFALSFSAFADGDMNTGGRTCEPNPDHPEQTCPADPPTGSSTATNGTTGTSDAENPGESEENTLNDLLNYLNSLFG